MILIRKLIFFCALPVLAWYVLFVLVLGDLSDANVEFPGARGKSIWTSYFREVSQGRETWPSSAQFATSTAFFRYVIDEGIMYVDGAYFGVPEERNDETDWVPVSSDITIWNVVADLEGNEDATPFLISANVNITRLGQPVSVDDLTDLYPGYEGVVVVSKGGTTMRLRGPEVAEYFAGLNSTNIVLRP